jgi:hypothetical protein
MTSFDFYAGQSAVTSPGKHLHVLLELPTDVGDIVDAIQHLVVYDAVASDFHGYAIPADRVGEIHLRTVEQVLDRLLAEDSQPLTVARPIERRVVGRCHHYVWLLIAALRARRVPARARCGFGSYFNAPHFEDHWICEYWNESRSRWQLVDAQFDDIWRARLTIDHDVADVPRDRFLTAGDAWQRCRAGEFEPARFGIQFVNLRGLWYVAGNIVRDIAALNKVEVRPWDVWGAQPKPDEKLSDAQLAWFDQLAALTRRPDDSFDQLRQVFAADERLRVPPIVYNALLSRSE